MNRSELFLLALLVILFPLDTALWAHVPQVGGQSKITVEDPSVSRVFYRRIESGDSHVYRLEFTEAQTMILGLNSPNPTPDPPSAHVDGVSGSSLISGSTKEPEYEPFAPDVYYPVGRIERTVPAGTYTIRVTGKGPYALVVGEAEEFTVLEWIWTAVEVPRTRLWAGRGWILLPGLLPLLTVCWWLRGRTSLTWSQWLTRLSGAFCIGTALTILTALGWSVRLVNPGAKAFVAIALFFFQAGAGAMLIRQSRSSRNGMRRKLVTVGLSLFALSTWAGAVIGPALGLSSVMLPSRNS